MNLHGHLATQGIEYGSIESIEFIDKFMEALNFYSLKSSMLIAKHKKETFLDFEKSDYADGSYFEQYVNKDESLPPINPEALKALGNVPIITKAMWIQLKQDVMNHGLFNAYRIAIAP